MKFILKILQSIGLFEIFFIIDLLTKICSNESNHFGEMNTHTYTHTHTHTEVNSKCKEDDKAMNMNRDN